MFGFSVFLHAAPTDFNAAVMLMTFPSVFGFLGLLHFQPGRLLLGFRTKQVNVKCKVERLRYKWPPNSGFDLGYDMARCVCCLTFFV